MNRKQFTALANKIIGEYRAMIAEGERIGQALIVKRQEMDALTARLTENIEQLERLNKIVEAGEDPGDWWKQTGEGE